MRPPIRGEKRSRAISAALRASRTSSSSVTTTLERSGSSRYSATSAPAPSPADASRRRSHATALQLQVPRCGRPEEVVEVAAQAHRLPHAEAVRVEQAEQSIEVAGLVIRDHAGDEDLHVEGSRGRTGVRLLQGRMLGGRSLTVSSRGCGRVAAYRRTPSPETRIGSPARLGRRSTAGTGGARRHGDGLPGEAGIDCRSGASPDKNREKRRQAMLGILARSGLPPAPDCVAGTSTAFCQVTRPVGGWKYVAHPPQGELEGRG